jgi:hypothetical protein
MILILLQGMKIFVPAHFCKLSRYLIKDLKGLASVNFNIPNISFVTLCGLVCLKKDITKARLRI